MKSFVFCISFFLFYPIFGKSQNVSSLRDSFMKYEYTDTLKARQYLDKIKILALKSKNKDDLAEFYLLKGWYYQDRSEFYDALESFKLMAKISRENGFLQREADAYGNMGNVYDDISDEVGRMEYHQRSLQICEKILKTARDSTTIKRALLGKSAAYGNLAYLYQDLNQTEKAIKMIREGMHIDSSLHNYEYLAISFSLLGNIYKDEKDYENALKHLRLGVKIRKNTYKDNSSDLGDEGIYQAYHNMGNIYKEMLMLDSAKHYYAIALRLSEKVGDKYHLTFIYSSHGDLERIVGNYDKAIENYKKGYDLALKLDALQQMEVIAKSMSEVYHLDRDYLKAYEYLLISNRYRDSLFNADKMRELGKAEVNYEFKFKSSLDSLNYAKNLEEKEELRKAENERHEAEATKRNFILFGVLFILTVVLIFSIYLIRLYRGKKRAHEIITAQKKMADHHLEIIAEKQKEIVDSINYAKRIQYALLAHEEMLKKYLPEHFVLFRPKDIVSGDFYWFTHFKDEKNEFSYLAVCDSTGHGVPGAFMSLLNISFINESITEKNILEPHLVFNHVRNRLMENLGKDGQNDGFDGILLRLDHHNGKMDYAASNNSPILISENGTTVLPCDKMPVGKGELSSSFGLFEIPQGKNGMLYLPTDGYSDQFGGEKGKKLKFSNMLKYMEEVRLNSVSEQAMILNSKFEKWKGELEQLDDVCIIGLKI